MENQFVIEPPDGKFRAHISRPAGLPAPAVVVLQELFGVTLPATLRYENQLAAAAGDFVVLHGRFSGLGPTPAWVVADIVRMEGGVLAEHWDVIQDEATQAQSRSGLPMFGDKVPA